MEARRAPPLLKPVPLVLSLASVLLPPLRSISSIRSTCWQPKPVGLGSIGLGIFDPRGTRFKYSCRLLFMLWLLVVLVLLQQQLWQVQALLWQLVGSISSRCAIGRSLVWPPSATCLIWRHLMASLCDNLNFEILDIGQPNHMPKTCFKRKPPAAFSINLWRHSSWSSS